MKAANLRKLFRFAKIYGPYRALYKAAGRLRLRVALPRRSYLADVAVIGCGQFAFSTVAYFLGGCRRRILACYDIDQSAAASFARSLGVPIVSESADSLLEDPGVKYVYVASNHATHSEYAARALMKGHIVYVEKPVAVSMSQLIMLEGARRLTQGQVFAGYNRPFSGAIRDLRKLLDVDRSAGISFSCFIAGHVLGRDHWYRRPGEGTRVCGNLGHWIDLFFHILSWRGLPDEIRVSIIRASDAEADDNLVLSMSSDLGDICSIMLTSRAEPFEGINESIEVQHSNILCKIDDFRRMIVWKGPEVIKRQYWPKDPGHRLAIEQPFEKNRFSRDWSEIVLSALIILRVTDMVESGVRSETFSLRSMTEEFEVAMRGVAPQGMSQ
jgi:predicted dehydrogenase